MKFYLLSVLPLHYGSQPGKQGKVVQFSLKSKNFNKSLKKVKFKNKKNEEISKSLILATLCIINSVQVCSHIFPVNLVCRMLEHQ